MISLGCDVGAIATKTVVLEEGAIAAYDVTPNEGRMKEAAGLSLEGVLSETGLTLEEILHRGGTGWGERYIPFEHRSESMIRCLARGAHWAVPDTRTAINIGGLSSTIISIHPDTGRVVEYRTNDRCASGTGFFLELAAQALEVKVEDLGSLSLSAKKRAGISAQCAVFGESEIVTHLNDGVDPAEIAAGLNYSIGASLASMAKRLTLEREVVITGGVAKNIAVVKALEEKLGLVTAPMELNPQLIGAVGAALVVLDTEKEKMR
jgi:predicted CoA-substrate-specific enzyme activase